MTHKWSEPVTFLNDRGEHWKTERTCVRYGCNVVMVTRHPPVGDSWREWWRDGERIQSASAPPCVAGETVTAA